MVGVHQNLNFSMERKFGLSVLECDMCQCSSSTAAISLAVAIFYDNNSRTLRHYCTYWPYQLRGGTFVDTTDFSSQRKGFCEWLGEDFYNIHSGCEQVCLCTQDAFSLFLSPLLVHNHFQVHFLYTTIFKAMAFLHNLTLFNEKCGDKKATKDEPALCIYWHFFGWIYGKLQR